MRAQKDQLWKRRWRVFRTCRRGIYSLCMLLVFLFLSLTAEFWSNDRPLVLFYQQQFYFPFINYYPPSDFDLPVGTVTTDYKTLELSSSDWAIWPLIPWSSSESNIQVSEYPSPPTWTNWMGTDNRGRDVLSRILYGFRYSFGFAFLVWLGSFFIGTFVGMFMGFRGGWIDLAGQRIVEIFQSMPFLLVLITFASIFGVNLWVLASYSILFGWMNISLYIRSEYLKIKQMEFIQSAQSYGVSNFMITFKHILPNALTPLVTFSPFKLAQGVYILAILDYLGFGLAPPTPSWGELLLQAEQYFTIGWWLALFPSLFLFLTLISLNFVGEGIRIAFDPKKL